MVQNTGTPGSVGAIRPLRAPADLEVEVGDDGLPRVIVLGGLPLQVTAVQDRWRIDDEWWRPRPISRTYHYLVLEDGRTLTAFQDQTTSRWYRQNYV